MALEREGQEAVKPVNGKALTDPSTTADPRAELCALLDRWSSLDDTKVQQYVVDEVRQDIERLVKAHPRKATTWFKAWRAAHRTAKLA